MTSSQGPLLVLVRSLARAYREYLLESIAREFRIWLFDDVEPTWESRYLAGHTVVDTRDSDAMIRHAARLVPAGVLCWDERRVVAAAALADALGLPGTPPDVVRRCRDKAQTRAALAAAGVPQPLSVRAVTPEEAQVAALRIGYPVVVKPPALNGSRGVVRVDGPDGIAAAFAKAVGAASPDVVDETPDGVLVEEYLDGAEISVDATCADGTAAIVIVARKQLGYPPGFEEIGHLVDGGDDLLDDHVLQDIVQGVHSAVGFRTGWTHSEYRLTPAGPKLIEINARLGGDRIPYIAGLALGIEPGRVAARVACGLDAPALPIRRAVGGVRFVYPPRDMLLRSVRVDEALLPAAVDSVVPLALPGQEVRMPPAGDVTGRVALVTAAARAPAECLAALDAATSAVMVEPLGRQRRRAVQSRA